MIFLDILCCHRKSSGKMAKTTAGSFFHTALDEEVDTLEK